MLKLTENYVCRTFVAKGDEKKKRDGKCYNLNTKKEQTNAKNY